MVETPIIKEILINTAIRKVIMEAKVVDISSFEYVIEQLVEVLSGIFLKCVMKM